MPKLHPNCYSNLYTKTMNKKTADRILDEKPIIKQVKTRWKSRMNKFWKKILKYSLIIGSSAAGILLMNSTFGLTEFVHPIVFTISGYVLTACGAMGLAAKLTKE